MGWNVLCGPCLLLPGGSGMVTLVREALVVVGNVKGVNAQCCHMQGAFGMLSEAGDV